MKASQFTDAQKTFIIKQGEKGTPVSVALQEQRNGQICFLAQTSEPKGPVAQ